MARHICHVNILKSLHRERFYDLIFNFFYWINLYKRKKVIL